MEGGGELLLFTATLVCNVFLFSSNANKLWIYVPYFFLQILMEKNMSLELIPIRIGRIRNGISPIPTRQNDADPTRLRMHNIGSTYKTTWNFLRA